MLKKSLFLFVLGLLAASSWVAAEDDRLMRRERVGRETTDTPRQHSPAVDGQPVFARADGWVYSAWAYRSDGEYSIAISFRDVYHDWSEPTFIGLGDGLDQVDPALASDDLGNLYLAYGVRQTGQIWMTARWSAGTTWFVPQRISIGSDRGVTPAVEVVGSSVVLAFKSEDLGGVRIFDWPILPEAPTGFQADGIQDGPDGFPLTGLTSPDDNAGGHDITLDRDDNTANGGEPTSGSGTRARTNGRTR